jgi:hypothetical protein
MSIGTMSGVIASDAFAETRQDVMIQKTDGCRKISPMLVDMRNVDTFDSQGDDLAAYLSSAGFSPRTTHERSFLGLETSFVEGDELASPILCCRCYRTGHVGRNRPYYRKPTRSDEASNGGIVEISFDLPAISSTLANL